MADVGWFVLLALCGAFIVLTIVERQLKQSSSAAAAAAVQIRPSSDNLNRVPNYAPSFAPNHPAMPQMYFPPPPSPALLHDSYSKGHGGQQPLDGINMPRIRPATYSTG